MERSLDFVQLERLYNRFDFFHASFRDCHYSPRAILLRRVGTTLHDWVSDVSATSDGRAKEQLLNFPLIHEGCKATNFYARNTSFLYTAGTGESGGCRLGRLGLSLEVDYGYQADH